MNYHNKDSGGQFFLNHLFQLQFQFQFYYEAYAK
jgi:hypothetical protein